MVDFLFVYEVKNRELENICLLKNELENRGYTVKMIETWYSILYYVPRIEAKVVVAFALYNDELVNYIASFSKNVSKIVNLQWEQLFAVAEEESVDSLHNVVGVAKNAAHISWGNFNYRRLIEKNMVNPNNAFVCGHMALDYYKPLLKGYFLSKDQLCKEYGLDSNKKIHLFISSFSYCETPDEVFKQDIYQKLAYDILELKRIAIKSQKEVLLWYERIASTNPEIQFVYRLHPAEVGNLKLKELQNKYKNFCVIGERSIKQWILVADTITTWISTSLAEIYAAKKTCAVLRPVDIPAKTDNRLYWGSRYIKTYEEFSKFIEDDKKGKEIPFPADEEIIRNYYTMDNEYSFNKICDVLEKVKNDPKYTFDYEAVVTRDPENVHWKKVKFFIKRLLVKAALIAPFLCRYSLIKVNVFNYKMIRKNYSTDKEIDDICKRLRDVIKANS